MDNQIIVHYKGENEVFRQVFDRIKKIQSILHEMPSKCRIHKVKYKYFIRQTETLVWSLTNKSTFNKMNNIKLSPNKNYWQPFWGEA